MTALVALAVLGALGGVALAASGVRPTDRPAPTQPSRADRRLAGAAAVGALTAAALYALTGWLVPALVVASAVAIAVARRSPTAATVGGAERVEALASWIENVRDVLQAGNQPIGALAATVDTCPPSIRPAVRHLSARLAAGQSAEVALRRFADDLDDPLADLVAVGLLIAISRGAQTDGVLTALAGQARHGADRRRIVEAERAPMRREVQAVSAVMCALLGGLFVFGRSSYLDAYDSAEGQIVLALVLAAYAGLVVWVLRLSRFPAPSRFLTLGDRR